ncbi:hypothetical protein EV356DRAFT_261194 [Viridothelium virens]|uniref:Uncharacterized protein n=1 Tax=Viridothelium virens TaxID=1048519 RepID=A0A6A6H2J0_VIRVR|nr:hypothetical protein EV356DRAFT_261194 [Viridothelium virens]
MRRQLQLRMGYRAVVKHLKPILQEIANRTEEKIDSDPEYHKRSERHEIVNAQLDKKLQQRLDHIDTEEGYTIGNAANNYERGCELLRTQYQEKIERVKDDLIGHLMNAYLTTLRHERKQNDEDATDDEEGGIVPYAKRRHLNGDLEPMFDTRYASRSRYFVETDRLWDERQERDRIAQDMSQTDENAKPPSPGKFAVHDSTDRNQAIAILNVSNLARASQAVEEGITEPPKHIENSAAMALQALATAAEAMPLARKPPKRPEPLPEPPTPTLPQEIITPSKPPNTTPQSSSTTQEKPGSVYVKWRLESHKKSKSGQMNGVRPSKKEAPTRSPAKIHELLNQDQAEERVAPTAAKRSKVAEDEFRPMGQIPPFSQRPASPPRMLGERRESIPGGFDQGRRHSLTQHPQPRPNEFAAVPIGPDRMQMLQEPLREPRPMERPSLQPPAQFPNEKRDYYQTPYRERSPERAPMPPPALQHVSNAHRRTRTGSGSASALASPVTPNRADQSPIAGPSWPPRRGSVERPTYPEDRRASMDTSRQRAPPAAMPPILHPTQPEPNRPQEHGYRPRTQSHGNPYPPNQARHPLRQISRQLRPNHTHKPTLTLYHPRPRRWAHTQALAHTNLHHLHHLRLSSQDLHRHPMPNRLHQQRTSLTLCPRPHRALMDLLQDLLRDLLRDLLPDLLMGMLHLLDLTLLLPRLDLTLLLPRSMRRSSSGASPSFPRTWILAKAIHRPRPTRCNLHQCLRSIIIGARARDRYRRHRLWGYRRRGGERGVQEDEAEVKRE